MSVRGLNWSTSVCKRGSMFVCVCARIESERYYKTKFTNFT